MIIMDLLVTLLILCVLVFGVENITIWHVLLAITLTALIVLVVHLLCSWMFERGVWGMFRAAEMKQSSRRRMVPGRVVRTRAEAGFDAMNEDELRAHLEKQPNDFVAGEILCERIKKAGRLAEYAREMEWFLNLKSDLTVEEKCTRWHELATLYLDKLSRPERGREILQTIIATYPTHYQATLARKRLEQLREAAS